MPHVHSTLTLFCVDIMFVLRCMGQDLLIISVVCEPFTRLQLSGLFDESKKEKDCPLDQALGESAKKYKDRREKDRAKATRPHYIFIAFLIRTDHNVVMRTSHICGHVTVLLARSRRFALVRSLLIDK